MISEIGESLGEAYSSADIQIDLGIQLVSVRKLNHENQYVYIGREAQIAV